MISTFRITVLFFVTSLIVGCGSSNPDSGDDSQEKTRASSSTPKPESKTAKQVAVKTAIKPEQQPNAKLDALVNIVENEQEFSVIYEARNSFLEHREMAIPRLIELLNNAKFVGLKNTADLIIWDRIANGDLKSFGHGGVVDDDLFVVAGRVSWILKHLTGQDFGAVSMKFNDASKKTLQQKWQTYAQERKANLTALWTGK